MDTDRLFKHDTLANRGLKELIDIENSIQNKQDETKIKQRVCIFYLQGTCRYSDEDCSFLHQNDDSKLSICKFFKEHGYCHRMDTCPYRHPQADGQNMGIAPSGNMQEPCPYYDRGFCHKGPDCRFMKHEFGWMLGMVNSMQNKM